MEPGRSFTFRCRGLMPNSFGIFEEMKRKGEFCDITIRFGSHFISAHKNVVAAAIPYFREKLSNQEFETDRKEITICELDAYALESLIEFAYTSTVEITTENVNTLLTAACFLGVSPVRDACCDFIAQRLNSESVGSIRQFAENMGCMSLVQSSDIYICKKFDEVSTSEIFLDESFHRIKEVISRDELQTSSEAKVFECVMNWVKRSPDERKSHLPELLSDVRMTLLTPEYLTDCLQEELISTSIPCRDLLEDARTYHFLPHRRPLISSFKTTARGQVKTIPGRDACLIPGVYAICCTTEKRPPAHLPAQSLQYLDPKSEEWKVLNSLSFTPCTTSSTTLITGNGRLHFYGSDYVISYDPPTENWIQSNNYVGHRLNAGVTCLRNKLYICGGMDEDRFLDTMVCFDLENNLLLDIIKMPHPASHCGAVELGDQLYILGGRNGNGVLKGLYEFSLAAKTWTTVALMNTARYAMGCAILDKKIYACGGKTHNNLLLESGEVYDPWLKHWTPISSMKTARYDFCLVSYDGKLYAIGGKDSAGTPLNSVEIYHQKINKWEYGTSLHPSVKFVKAASVQPPP